MPEPPVVRPIQRPDRWTPGLSLSALEVLELSGTVRRSPLRLCQVTAYDQFWHAARLADLDAMSRYLALVGQWQEVLNGPVRIQGGYDWQLSRGFYEANEEEEEEEEEDGQSEPETWEESEAQPGTMVSSWGNVEPMEYDSDGEDEDDEAETWQENEDHLGMWVSSRGNVEPMEYDSDGELQEPG